jgi:hypothetical protein
MTLPKPISPAIFRIMQSPIRRAMNVGATSWLRHAWLSVAVVSILVPTAGAEHDIVIYGQCATTAATMAINREVAVQELPDPELRARPAADDQVLKHQQNRPIFRKP